MFLSWEIEPLWRIYNTSNDKFRNNLKAGVKNILIKLNNQF